VKQRWSEKVLEWAGINTMRNHKKEGVGMKFSRLKLVALSMIGITFTWMTSFAGSTPKPQKLPFPVSELIPRLVKERAPYNGFDHTKEEKKEYLKGRSSVEFIYNIPEVGKSVSVTFYTFPAGETHSNDWFFVIDYPKIKPKDLFAANQIRKLSDTLFEWNVYEVISGPILGACVKDFSLDLTTKGFSNPNDKAIVVTSKYRNSVGKNINDCE
jgi:hypothetical protein